MRKTHLYLLGIALCSLLSTKAQVKSYEKLGEMIRTNSFSTKNPIYKIPYATKNGNSYLISAITVGEAVQKPLAYFGNEKPKDYYINFSRSATFLERGKSFDLVLTANKSATTTVKTGYAYAFADWNRDGTFETNVGEFIFSDLATNEFVGTKQSITIPKTAGTGKTRIRIIFTTSKLTSVNPETNQSQAFIYDFVIFIKEKTTTNDKVLVSVASNDEELGNVIIEDSELPNNPFQKGESVTVKTRLSNKPKYPASFKGWSNGISIVSTDTEYTFNANNPIFLIALFEIPKATLEDPIVSTAKMPVWYQIENAHSDSRDEHYIAFSEEIPAGYTTQLRIEKPVTFEDKFLWRLEASTNNMVKIINKGTGKQLYSQNGQTSSAKEVGSDYFVTKSGHSNGSYSIKWNNNSQKLLNGNPKFKLLLYGGGVGTGSGWFFYKVPPDFTSVENVLVSPYHLFFLGNNLHIKHTKKNETISIFDLSGRKLTSLIANSEEVNLPFDKKGLFVVCIKQTNGQLYNHKVVNQ